MKIFYYLKKLLHNSLKKMEPIPQSHISTEQMCKKRGIILVFDTETTGLLPQNKNTNNGIEKVDEIETLPYITQLAFALYDADNFVLMRTYNQYIRIPPHVVISEKITELTGITNEMCMNRGVRIEDALIALYQAVQEADIIVAHNINFDMRMVSLETKRNVLGVSSSIINLQPNFQHYCAMNKKRLYCTMHETREFVGIRVVSKATGKPYFKNPTLGELYRKIYGDSEVRFHNAFDDVIACLKCYMRVRYGSLYNIDESPDWESNPGSPVYKTGALPLSHQGADNL